jgi:hypothetical protein
VLCSACDYGGTADVGDDVFAEAAEEDVEFSTDAQLALALRAVYARHRHDLRLTRRTSMQKTDAELGRAARVLGRAERVIKTTITLFTHEEAETKAARGRLGDEKPSTPEAVHAVALTTISSAMSIDHGEVAGRTSLSASALAAATEAAEDVVGDTGEAQPEGRSKPARLLGGGPWWPTPAVIDNGPLRSTVVVLFHGDDDNGGLWDYDEKEEAVRQDSGGVSATAAACGSGLPLSQMF